MTLDEWLKILDAGRSPLLMLLCAVAWQTIRAVFRGLEVLEQIRDSSDRTARSIAGLASKIEDIDEKADNLKDDIAGLPLDLLRLRSAFNQK